LPRSPTRRASDAPTRGKLQEESLEIGGRVEATIIFATPSVEQAGRIDSDPRISPPRPSDVSSAEFNAFGLMISDRPPAT